jgi:general secretion pathway protein B
MSLILDALRKIEQERKARRQGSGDIRSDVLSYRATTPPPARSRLVPLLGLGLVLLAVLSGLYLWRKDTPTRVTVQRPDAAP